MHAPPAIDPRSIDPRLRRELRRMVRRVEAHRLHRHSALAWIACALALLAVLVVARETGATPLSVVAGMTALVVACGALVARWWAAPANNYTAAAAFVEGAHPELRHALRSSLVRLSGSRISAPATASSVSSMRLRCLRKRANVARAEQSTKASSRRGGRCGKSARNPRIQYSPKR